MSWSSDSTKIVSTAQDYVVRIWQTDTGKTLYTHQYPSRAPMGKVAWSHNNQLVATYPGTATIDILDAQLTVKQTIQTGVTYDFSWSPEELAGHLTWTMKRSARFWLATSLAAKWPAPRPASSIFIRHS